MRIWTYQTQLWQARAYETAMSLWRRLKADASASTMGILCARPSTRRHCLCARSERKVCELRL